MRWAAVQAAKLAIPLVVTLIALVVVGDCAGAPPDHDVNTYGGKAVSFQVADSGGMRPVLGPITPTMSLLNVRCDAWLQTNPGPCPDDEILAREYWPRLTQAPRTLYVGLLSVSCDFANGDPHVNVESAGEFLVFHCHYTAPWITLERGPSGVSVEVVSQLVLVPTQQLSPGPLYVFEEDRVERWFNDQATMTQVGFTTIPNS